MIPTILKSGRHEIGVHGWIHEHLPSVNDAAAEQDMLNRAIETLTKAIGKKPVGYRAPSWQFSPWTMKQVKDAGFLYDSSLMASDDAYEILLDKQPTGVVELPIERILDDFPYFGGATNGGMPNPDLDRTGLPVGVRRRLRGRRTVHPDDAPAHHRTPVARRGSRKADRAHEVEAGRVVRDARADRALREGQQQNVNMPFIELVASSGLGSLLGMRHALEPDHLAAVSTLVTGERSTLQGGVSRRVLGARPHVHAHRDRRGARRAARRDAGAAPRTSSSSASR